MSASEIDCDDILIKRIIKISDGLGDGYAQLLAGSQTVVTIQDNVVLIDDDGHEQTIMLFD